MLAELWNDLRYRLRALARGADLDREARGRDRITSGARSRGVRAPRHAAAEARRQAPVAFGGLEGVRERSRDERRTRGLRTIFRISATPGGASDAPAALAHDHRAPRAHDWHRDHGLQRRQRRSARSLPFADPDRIALVSETRANTAQNTVGGHQFPESVRANRTFDGLSPMIYDEGVHLTGAGDPIALLGVRVAAPFFQVMGVTPGIGRAFSAGEDSEGRGSVVVLSDRSGGRGSPQIPTSSGARST